jgi:hypothetical protein
MRPAYRQGDVTARLPREELDLGVAGQRDAATAELVVQYGPGGLIAAQLVGEDLEHGEVGSVDERAVVGGAAPAVWRLDKLL